MDKVSLYKNIYIEIVNLGAIWFLNSNMLSWKVKSSISFICCFWKTTQTLTPKESGLNDVHER